MKFQKKYQLNINKHQILIIMFKHIQKLHNVGQNHEYQIVNQLKVIICKNNIICSNYYDVTKIKNQSSFEYYIHYDGINRRCDQWISYQFIKKTNQKIPQEDHYKNKNNNNNKKNQQKLYEKYTQHQGMDSQSLQAHQEATKIKTINRIQIGKYRSDTWYYSPYPAYYHNTECLYICQFCLNFFRLLIEYKRHAKQCILYHPPGDQCYRDNQHSIAVFQVDGLRNSTYCQNLGFLSKLFLDHKTLEFDMSIFLFYILCQMIDGQYHIAGYFSKPKQSFNNLSCILVLPFYQRKGYGKFLITFSYQLSLIQGKIGTPEKPLSDLGRETYLSWWSQRLIDYIRLHKHHSFNLQDIVKQTAITEQDIYWTMQQIGILKISAGQPYLCIDQQMLEPIYKKNGRLGKAVIKQNIHWVPFRVKWQNQVFL